MINIEGKIVVVTGGAGLLGKEFAKAIAEHGGITVIADVNKGTKETILSALKKKAKGGKFDFSPLDITSKQSIVDLIKYLVAKYGKIDVLVNCAYPRNSNFGRNFEEVAYEDFCENVNGHLGGYFLASQQFAIFFKKQGYGHVINVASVYGVVAPRFEIYEGTKMTSTIEYAAIKSAIIHLTKYMAKYFKKSGIRFNCISPGGILDHQHKDFLKRYNNLCLSKGMLDAEDLTGTLLFLISEASRYINGQNIIVDDGFVL